VRINVFASKELQATIVALKTMDRELAKQTRAAVKSVGQPEWQDAVKANVTTRLESRVLGDTARVAVSDQNVTLKSAAMGKKLSQYGATPSELAHSAEFGADREYVGSTISPKGKRYTRHTRRQFEARNRKGRVVYPAAAKFIPRMAALYVQTTVRTLYEAFEKKG